MGRSSDRLRGAFTVAALREAALASLFAAVLLASGCATHTRQWFRNGFQVGPNYCPPKAPLSENWIEASDPRVKTTPPRDGSWWDVFEDPILSSLIVRAYRQNPNLRSVGARVLQARAQQKIAVGSIFPQTQEIVGLYPNGTSGGGSSHLDLTAFNLSWELDFWGKYRRQVESAGARFDASVEDYDDSLVTLLADVATNYVQFRVAQQRIEIACDNLQTQEWLVELAEKREKVGTGTKLNTQQLRTLMEQTRSSIPALEITRGEANDRLCILLGEPPRCLDPELGPPPDVSSAPMPQIPNCVAAGLPAELLRRRPDVRSAERRAAAQNAQIGVAIADFYPSVSIGTILGHSDLELGVGPSSNGFLGFVVPQFSWKIVNYGRIANNVRLQDAKTQELVATYQNKVLTAAQEVQTALRGFLRSQEQAEALVRSETAAVTAASIEEKNFTDLKTDMNRLFTLENSQLQVQDQLAVVRGNVALNLISVYRALGGGWELRQQQNCLLEAKGGHH